MEKTELLPRSPSKFRYQRVMDAVAEGVRTGRYRKGDRLPSLRVLSKEIGTNFQNVHRAITRLAEKGVLEIRPGSGTFVSGRARALDDKETIRIGLLYGASALEDAPHPTVGAFISGANQRCKPPAYLVQPLFYDFPLHETIGPTILKEGISGCAIMGGRMEEPDFAFFRDHHIHAVRYREHPHHDGWMVTVSNDEHAAMTQLVEHLRSLGHRRIGFITYASDAHDARFFCQLAYDHQLGDPSELIIPVSHTGSTTHWEDVEKFFSCKPLPTAVMVWDEFIIDILLNGCHRRGIDVPRDLSLVSVYDSRPLGHRIPVTSVLTDASLSRVAYTACDLLVRHISGQPIPRDFIKFSSTLNVKASSGPVAGRKP